MQIRSLNSLTEMAQVEDLQRRIWGYGEKGADPPLPARIIYSVAQSGGLVAGAFSADTLIGFSVAWIGRRPAGKPRYYMHSQMVGIVGQQRHRQLGYQIKLHQRQWALRHGLNLIRWTFDPLQSANARLNLHKLGAEVEHYLPDYFGQMRNRFNSGLASDRVWAEWWVDSARVAQRLAGVEAVEWKQLPCITSCQLQRAGRVAELVLSEAKLGEDSPEFLVQVPDNFGQLLSKAPQLAQDWRVKLRQVFTHYLEKNYRVTDLHTTGSKAGRAVYYQFTRKAS